MKLTEAFRALNALNEDTFSVSDDGIAKLAEFEQNDDLADDISVIDPEAETEEDLEDSYVGKIILDCTVCHSKLYKDIEEIELDEEQTLANVGEECPYCYTSDGFKVLGQVSAFGGKADDAEDDDTNTDDVDDNTATSDDDDSVDENLSEGIFGLGKKKKPNFYSKEEIARRRQAREAEFNKQKAERDRKERERGAEIARGWKEREEREKQAERDYNRSRYNSIKGSNVSNTGKAGVHYSGGDYYSESLEENLLEAPVATLERPMSGIGGTLSNVMAEHSDELANVYDTASAISFLDSIEPEVKNKGYLQNIKAKLAKMSGTRAAQFLYNIILKGDGMGTKMESVDDTPLDESKSIKESFHKEGWVLRYHNGDHYVYWKADDDYTPDITNPDIMIYDSKEMALSDVSNVREIYADLTDWEDGIFEPVHTSNLSIDESKSIKESVNNVNVETDDSIVNVNTDDSGKVTVTTEPKTAEEAPVDGAEVITPLTDENEQAILNNDSDMPLEDEEEFVDTDIEEFDDETFDGLGESYLKKVYENVASYKTTDVSMKENKLFLEGVITFNSGASKKTSFIFEAKDFTKSGKYRFIGENTQLTRGKKAFTLKGRIDEKKFITESFNYNYKAKDTAGNSTRIYGTIKG